MANLNSVLNSRYAITLTTVSYDTAKDSYNDYQREETNYINGYSVTWDSDRFNKTQIGDLFAFVWGNGCYPNKVVDGKLVGDGAVQIREVIGKLSPANRPAYWNNPKHSHREVLVLGEIIYEGTWVELEKALGGDGTYIKNNNIVNGQLYGTERRVYRNPNL